MDIRPPLKRDFARLKQLFIDYYAELDCEDDAAELFDEYVLPDFGAKLLNIALLYEEDRAQGFVIFQIDDVINDWCFKDGLGDVREIYVCPENRGRGLGAELLTYAENSLKKSGATRVYTLPTEESEKFFLSRGYADCGDYCAELDNKVFEKQL